jgi:hypothetical protein
VWSHLTFISRTVVINTYDGDFSKYSTLIFIETTLLLHTHISPVPAPKKIRQAEFRLNSFSSGSGKKNKQKLMDSSIHENISSLNSQSAMSKL